MGVLTKKLLLLKLTQHNALTRCDQDTRLEPGETEKISLLARAQFRVRLRTLPSILMGRMQWIDPKIDLLREPITNFILHHEVKQILGFNINVFGRDELVLHLKENRSKGTPEGTTAH